MYVDLAEVRKTWLERRGGGLVQLSTSGKHCHVYQDVFGCEFWPLGCLEVSYSDTHPVTWGDMIPAKQALSEPRVTLPDALSGSYATLLLTSPDGHLQDNMRELLHWMM